MLAATAAAAVWWMNAHICPLCGPTATAAPSLPASSFATTTFSRSAAPSVPARSQAASDANTALWPVWPMNR